MRNIPFLIALAATAYFSIAPQTVFAAPGTPTVSNSGQLKHAPSPLPAPTDAPPTVRPEYDHGPRAGFMRGTKDIQSELLLGPGSGIRLYFVDAQWIDLPLKDTSLKVSLKPKGVAGEGSPLPCVLSPDSYSCALPKGVVFAIGDSLEVKLTKAGDSPQEYTFRYSFPFQSSEH
jgi:hypothetical protein